MSKLYGLNKGLLEKLEKLGVKKSTLVDGVMSLSSDVPGITRAKVKSYIDGRSSTSSELICQIESALWALVDYYEAISAWCNYLAVVADILDDSEGDVVSNVEIISSKTNSNKAFIKFVYTMLGKDYHVVVVSDVNDKKFIVCVGDSRGIDFVAENIQYDDLDNYGTVEYEESVFAIKTVGVGKNVRKVVDTIIDVSAVCTQLVEMEGAK